MHIGGRTRWSGVVRWMDLGSVVFWLAVGCLAVGCLAVGCTANDESTEDGSDVPVASTAPADGADDTAADDTAFDDTAFDDTVDGCDRRTIGEDFGPLTVAYGAEQGLLAEAPCLGEPDVVVESAWEELVAVAPVELVEAVAIVAGFDDAESDTLAFAGPVENDSDEHLIAVGVAAAVDDPEELRLTMAHELAHVFTQTPEQIDVAIFDDECDTLFNGFGCFQPDAYVTAWVDQFWDPTEIASLPEDYSADIEGGEERCLVDAGFPGAYAASHPEEDFAESFSAYVFDVELPASVDDRLAFFDDYPEFTAMRDAVRREGWASPPNNFDDCG